jgi:hypothetical protein
MTVNEMVRRNPALAEGLLRQVQIHRLAESKAQLVQFGQSGNEIHARIADASDSLLKIAHLKHEQIKAEFRTNKSYS